MYGWIQVLNLAPGPLWDGGCDCCVCPGSDLTPGTSTNIDKHPEFLLERVLYIFGA